MLATPFNFRQYSTRFTSRLFIHTPMSWATVGGFSAVGRKSERNPKDRTGHEYPRKPFAKALVRLTRMGPLLWLMGCVGAWMAIARSTRSAPLNSVFTRRLMPGSVATAAHDAVLTGNADLTRWDGCLESTRHAPPAFDGNSTRHGRTRRGARPILKGTPPPRAPRR